MKSILWPEFKEVNRRGGKLLVDSHGSGEGFIFAAINEPVTSKLKLRILQYGNYGATYSLNNTGAFELFPLTKGPGFYSVVLYSNTHANAYEEIGAVGFNVLMDNPDAAFYLPNQYVNYTKDSQVVSLATNLHDGKSDRQYFEEVKAYIRNHFAYDFIKAVTRSAGMLPEIDASLNKCMGICQDLSAIVVAMLRSQGIKSKLVIGSADNHYHAWTVSEIDGEEILYDPTVDIYGMSAVNEYVPERVY